MDEMEEDIDESAAPLRSCKSLGAKYLERCCHEDPKKRTSFCKLKPKSAFLNRCCKDKEVHPSSQSELAPLAQAAGNEKVRKLYFICLRDVLTQVIENKFNINGLAPASCCKVPILQSLIKCQKAGFEMMMDDF